MPDEHIPEQEESSVEEPESEDVDLGEGDETESEESAPIEKVPIKQVPLPELMEERKKRQALETRINRESEQNRVLKERLDTILQKIQEAETPAERPPVYEEDPAAYLKWQNDQLLAERRVEAERKAQEETQTRQQRQFHEVRQTIKQGINQFAESVPDYDNAAKYLVEARKKELEVMGITDQNVIMQRLEQDEIEVGYWALQQGMSPGEVFYNLAKTRGYSGGKDTGTFDTVRKGQQAATSLSKASGGAEGEITTEALLAMSDDDFAKFTKGKKWAKLHGRKG